jgi:hypothetical protein
MNLQLGEVSTFVSSVKDGSFVTKLKVSPPKGSSPAEKEYTIKVLLSDTNKAGTKTKTY